MFQKRLPSGLVNEIVNVYGVPTWISCIKPKETQSKIFVLVIPGNPGPIGFYESFIESLFLTSDCSLTIYGISHAGHHFIPCECNIETSEDHSGVNCRELYFFESKLYTLYDQVDHKLAFVYKFLPYDSEIILIGHSVGAFIILEIMRRLQSTERIVKGVLLFPTVERITKTSSGRFWTSIALYMQQPLLWIVWLFNVLPFSLQHTLVDFCVLIRGFSYERNIPLAILSFLNEHGVRNMLQIVKDMIRIEDLPQETVIEENKDNIVFYYAEEDPWVPSSFYSKMTERFPSADIQKCTKQHKHAFVLYTAKRVGKLVWGLISDAFDKLK